MKRVIFLVAVLLITFLFLSGSTQESKYPTAQVIEIGTLSFYNTWYYVRIQGKDFIFTTSGDADGGLRCIQVKE